MIRLAWSCIGTESHFELFQRWAWAPQHSPAWSAKVGSRHRFIALLNEPLRDWFDLALPLVLLFFFLCQESLSKRRFIMPLNHQNYSNQILLHDLCYWDCWCLMHWRCSSLSPCTLSTCFIWLRPRTLVLTIEMVDAKIFVEDCEEGRQSHLFWQFQSSLGVWPALWLSLAHVFHSQASWSKPFSLCWSKSNHHAAWWVKWLFAFVWDYFSSWFIPLGLTLKDQILQRYLISLHIEYWAQFLVMWVSSFYEK